MMDMLENELQFITSRSSGPGGQNVNKVNSKVTIKFDVNNSKILTSEQKEILLTKLRSRLTTEGVLILSSQEKRSQLDNKEAAVEKFRKVIAKAFERKKIRRTSKPSKSAVQSRINKKKQVSEKKKWRQKPI